MYRQLFYVLSFVCVSLYSIMGIAQVEVVTPQLINQYGLDFSDQKYRLDHYSVVVGSAELLDEGYDVTTGALYYLDRRSKTVELISKTRAGQPALIKKHNNGYAGNFEASQNFDVIAYISTDNNIVTGDTGNNQDVFIYERVTGHTRRVKGTHSHQGDISGLRLSPTGEHLAFESQDQAFGGPVAALLSNNMLYVYDLLYDFLSPLPYQEQTNDYPEYTELTTANSQSAAFTLDGKHLFFGVSFSGGFGDYGSLSTYIYNLETEKYNYIHGSLLDGSPAMKALSNNYYLYNVDDLTGSDVWVFSYKEIYDVANDQTIRRHEGDNAVLAGLSSDKRYAAFYSTTYNHTADFLYDESSGVVSIMDTQTGEFRRAFAVRSAMAMTYNDEYTGRPQYCSAYLFNSEFYQTPQSSLPCNTNPVLPRQQYIANSVETYNLDTANVRFHNLGRHLTFEANSWFVDERIAYDDYDYDVYSNNVRRDHYVIANPFLNSIALDGAPIINRATDKGWFIWRENGIWKNRFVAGGSKLDFEGGIRSGRAMSGLQPFSMESNDELALNPGTELNFKLKVTGPYQDGFAIKTASSAITCASLESPPGFPIHLGPMRVLMPKSFDLNTANECQLDRLATLGRPEIKRNMDNGIFLWRNRDDEWQVEVVSADRPRWVAVSVWSSAKLGNIGQVNIESNDTFDSIYNTLSTSLRVRAPWYDGFRFSVVNGSDTCVSTGSEEMPVYLGSKRKLMGKNVNLNTLKSC